MSVAVRIPPRAGAALALAAMAASGAVAAQPPAARAPLREVARIDDAMLWAALAIEIAERCDTLSARRLAGLDYLWSLRDDARRLGYTEDEIRAYAGSAAEKARMRRRGEAYVRDRGLDPASDADLCTLGAMEIGRGSQVGALLTKR